MSDEKLLTGPAGKELTIDGAIAPVVVAEEHLPHEAKRFLRIGMLILLVLVGGFFAWAALAPLDGFHPALMQPPVAFVAPDAGCRGREVPSLTHGRPDPVAGLVVPRGREQQAAGVAVASLGDRAERA